jgi:hypothetical protein
MCSLPAFCQSGGPVSGRALARGLAGRPAWQRAIVLAPFVLGTRQLSPLSAVQAASLAGTCVPYIHRGTELVEDPHQLALVLSGARSFSKVAHFSPGPFKNVELAPESSTEAIDTLIASAGVEAVWSRLVSVL